jgi:hypothetical protein
MAQIGVGATKGEALSDVTVRSGKRPREVRTQKGGSWGQTWGVPGTPYLTLDAGLWPG